MLPHALNCLYLTVHEEQNWLFFFRDGRTEEGFIPSSCHRGVSGEVFVTSSGRCKTEHMAKKTAGNAGRMKTACIPHSSQRKTNHSWPCFNGASELYLEAGAWALHWWYALCVDYADRSMLPGHTFPMQLSGLKSISANADRDLQPFGLLLTSEVMVWLFWISKMCHMPCVPFKASMHYSMSAYLRQAKTTR